MGIKEPLQARQLYLRKRVLEESIRVGNGHIASAMSCVDILDSIYSIKKPEDRVILSKGHACMAWWIVLEEYGYKPDINKQHPDIDIENGIECTTGSLGHGLPVGVGMALAKKLKNKSGRIFVIISDGECQEGTTWESLMLASHYKLDNLVIIIDNNKLQALDRIENVLSLGNLQSKLVSFGATTLNIDGHNSEQLRDSISMKSIHKPLVIIADTIKGSGVSFMREAKWHNRIPDNEQIKIALKELS